MLSVTLVSTLLAAPPASDLPIAAAGTDWLARQNRPELLLRGAEAALERWGDPRRIRADFYVPDPVSELVVALVAVDRARADGASAEETSVSLLAALGDAWAVLGATPLLVELGHDFVAAYPEAQRAAVQAYLATLEQLPSFVGARLPAEAEALLARDPKNVAALRALTRWELSRLRPQAALPTSEQLAALSEDAADHLLRAEALVLSAEHDADAKGAVSALVRRFPETALAARRLLARRAPFRVVAGAQPTTLEEAVTRLGAFGSCLPPRHPALARAMLDVRKDFPGPDGDAMGAGWLMLVNAYTLALEVVQKLGEVEAKTPLARGIRFSLGMVAAAQRLFQSDDAEGVAKSAQGLNEQLDAFPGGYEVDVGRAVFALMTDLTTSPEGKAAFAAFRGGGEGATAAMAARIAPALEPLRERHKKRAGPHTVEFLLRFLTEPDAFASVAAQRLAALEKGIAESDRSTFDWASSVFLLRLGRRPGHHELLGLAEARAMRLIERFEAFEAGVRKLPAAATDICPKTGCADIAGAYSVVGAARNARRATIPADEQPAWDFATIGLMRKGERHLADHGDTTRAAHAEIMSHRCVALLHRGDVGAVEQCVSDLVDAHPDDVLARAGLAALYAGDDRARERSFATLASLTSEDHPLSLRHAAARWAAGVAHNLGDSGRAADFARLARETRGALVARGDAPELSHDLVDSTFQVSFGFNLDGQLTAYVEVALRTGSLIRAPIDDDVLDALARPAPTE